MDSLVSAEWLAAHLGEPDLVLVDCSWHMPASGRSGRDEYLAAHIPGARFLDIDEVSRHGAPRAAHAAQRRKSSARRWSGSGSAAATESSSTTIRPCEAPRAAGSCCAISALGSVAILDGGMQRWLAEGRPTESGEPPARTARFDAARALGEVVGKEQILAGVGTALVDARGKGRFEGSEPDPRPGVAAGPYPRRPQPAVQRALPGGRAAQERRRAEQMFEMAGYRPANRSWRPAAQA